MSLILVNLHVLNALLWVSMYNFMYKGLKTSELVNNEIEATMIIARWFQIYLLAVANYTANPSLAIQPVAASNLQKQIVVYKKEKVPGVQMEKKFTLGKIRKVQYVLPANKLQICTIDDAESKPRYSLQETVFVQKVLLKASMKTIDKLRNKVIDLENELKSAEKDKVKTIVALATEMERLRDTMKAKYLL